LVAGAVGGIVGAVYSYYRGALPIRVAFAAVGDAGVWWAVAAFVTWLVRPSRRRAIALGAAVLLTAIVGGIYLLVQYWTGQYLGYVALPDGASGVAGAPATVAPTSIVVEPGTPEWYIQQARQGTLGATAQPASVQSIVQELDRLRVGPTPQPGTLDYYRQKYGMRPGEGLAGRCIYWVDAGQHVGKEVCICGTVHHIQNKDGTGYIHFDAGTEAFYGFRSGWEWYEGVLAGRCVLICGTVKAPNGRPQIRIDDPDEQLLLCP
jgi:hypothetical protein